MGYVPRDATTPGAQLFAEVRGKRLPLMVSELPFVPTRYKRL
jgi:aminomethyltransferase